MTRQPNGKAGREYHKCLSLLKVQDRFLPITGPAIHSVGMAIPRGATSSSVPEPGSSNQIKSNQIKSNLTMVDLDLDIKSNQVLHQVKSDYCLGLLKVQRGRQIHFSTPSRLSLRLVAQPSNKCDLSLPGHLNIDTL